MDGQKMAESPRDKIVSDLRKEEERVSAAAQEMREKAKALEAELKSVQSAIAALTGESKRAAKKKPVEETTPPDKKKPVAEKTPPPATDEPKRSPKRKKKTPQEGKE